MADFGFGAEIGRDEDANRWALATADVVAGSGDWLATPVTGQRAVTISAGQGQAAQITMPGGVGAKTEQVVLQLPFSGSMTHQGKLICRELIWTGNGSETDPLDGDSSFVVLNAGDFSAFPVLMPDWRARVSTDSASGFVRRPGERYLMPLHYAVVNQSSNEVRHWDLRRWPGKDECGFDVQATQNDALPSAETFPIGPSTWGAAPTFIDGFTWQAGILTALFDCVTLVTLTTGIAGANGSAVLRHRFGAAADAVKDYITDGASAVVTVRIRMRAGDKIEPRVYTAAPSAIRANRTSLSVTVLR